jgi:hypothetical protein
MPSTSYTRELESLPDVYRAARLADANPLRAQLAALACGPARMVGTGGTATLALLATQLHERISGQPASAMTPLAFLQAPRLHRAGAALFSARAKHPDARLVIEQLADGEHSPAVLVTHRTREELGELVRGDLSLVSVPAFSSAEGFLATGSVLGMSVLLLRAALGDDALGDLLPIAPIGAEEFQPRERLLVLYPPDLSTVAVDIETRCSELGLAAVQLSDLRNVAHGRHTGLARQAESTSVLVLSDEDSGPLAQALATTLEPSGAEIVRWHVDQQWPNAVVGLLSASMRLIGKMGSLQGFDPARPRVPAFGRRLYHLPLRRLLAKAPVSPVDRKLAALGGGQVVEESLRERYDAEFQRWSRELASTPIGALVLDYDGTICETAHRYEPLPEAMRHGLARVLDGGICVGFASGRGKSLHEQLRRVVAQRHWELVTLGLYNGAVLMSLAEDLGEIATPSALMAEVHQRLGASPIGKLLSITSRSGQVSVAASSGGFFQHGRLATLVTDVLSQTPALPIKVVASAHSVDILASDTSKASVLERVQRGTLGEVLAVGDQGDIGGNDFELLSAQRWSISVGRCSADPSRCWSVDPLGRRGATATLALLESVALKTGTARVDVSRIRRRPRHA